MTGPISHLRIVHRGIFGCWAKFAVGVIVAVLSGGGGEGQVLLGQDPPQFQGDEKDFAAQVLELVDGLRSDQFAVREEASEKLFRIGHLALPVLRSTRRMGGDAEQTDRLERIIDSLAKQDIESKINSFLRGGKPELENWPEFEKWFGDSPRVRELFVDLYREHPDLVESLGGSPQQLSVGLALVARRIAERGVAPQETPLRLDLIALLLPMMDANFDAEPQYDFLLTDRLQLYPANEFQSDLVFGKPIMRMVSQWMFDCDKRVRGQVLPLALQWNLKVGLPLALKTLTEDPSPVLLCRCMQAIARQGNREHAILLSGYLNDSTVVFGKPYPGTLGTEVQVGDVAAASIAYLSAVPVTEIGFVEPAEHKIFGIIFEELVVPLKDLPEKKDDEEQDEEEDDEGDEKLKALMIPNGFRQSRLSPDVIKKLQTEARQREASRIEIHRNAMKLVPQG